MTDFTWSELDERAVKLAKVLSADAVEKAGSGHPGSPISLAPVAYTLYQHFIKHDPNDPNWAGRDRFILSGGHASLTEYVQLYFSGYGLTLDDLKRFRTAGTRTPGHPEYGLTPGIEMTTGPLGQGLASAVGFAYGQRYQRGLLDPEAPAGESPFDHKVWVICGEGDVEEGVSSEASSLAGNQQLGNLTVIFDANHIQIEGDTKIAFSEDILKRYEAYGWYTDEFSFIQPDGSYKEDAEGFAKVLEKAEQVTDRPKLIKVDSLIAWPTPGKTNDPSSHGSKLGAEAVAGLKKELGYDPEQSFQVDEDALSHARKVAERGLEAHKAWDEKFATWKAANPDKAALYDRIAAGKLPEDFDKAIDELVAGFTAGSKVATRKASGAVLNAIAAVMPELWGGSADLGGSNNTNIKGAASFAPDEYATVQWPTVSKYGRQLHFGVREFAMGAITNGILLGSNTRPFGGTFFQFADYERPAVRLAALMDIPNLFVWTHDSVALGEDGPTHQPIEHLAAVRGIPQLEVVRPADEFETAEAYRYFFEKNNTHPAAFILTRQGVPSLEETKAKAKEGVRKGAYVLIDTDGEPDVLLLATGSEVQHAVEAAKTLAGEGVKARVISVPSLEWFEEQDDEYKEEILPSTVKARVSVEAGIAMPWYKYLGSYGKPVSIEQFGLQGDGDENMRDLGITAEHVVEAAKASIEEVKAAR
ncbi:transketolase [Bifidobacterium crudilactis]|uniref:transketolase n=1 Tax=Bifidobacterium crudilactis TaxID=327277 RepID=UPI002647026E|nr:transketolase [Bifidobacterium crudilactis]MDN5972282.1 transketolase [Bifidobacterium crudilactis]MDN6001696.1 transketolase [Bifidobacterium crudilactis]MDN6467035.1 transketolase [Bifidobacterium crudilactis]MDN6522600.1 transketolase [Bifidobacterium crudilactis]MDN6558563.1 transketolase [Bifidobacterium crudilactis]